MRQNFIAQFIQLLKHWLCSVQLGVVKNWADSGDQCQLQALQFWVHLIDLLSILLRCNGFARIQKALMDQTVSRPPNRDHDLFLVQVWLWEVLWSFFLVQPLSWSSLQLRNGSLLFCRVREDDNAKWQFFVSSWGTHLSSFFTFPICFKCQMTIELSMLSSLATSRVVVRESALMTALNCRCCQLLMASHCAHLQGSHLLCKTSWTTTALYVH